MCSSIWPDIYISHIYSLHSRDWKQMAHIYLYIYIWGLLIICNLKMNWESNLVETGNCLGNVLAQTGDEYRTPDPDTLSRLLPWRATAATNIELWGLSVCHRSQARQSCMLTNDWATQRILYRTFVEPLDKVYIDREKQVPS